MPAREHKPPGKKGPSQTTKPSKKPMDGAQAHGYKHSLQAMGYESGRKALAPGGRSTGPAGATHAPDARSNDHAPTPAGEDQAHAATQAGSKASGEPKRALFDLSGVINPGAVAAALSSIANEPGEAGVMSFEVSALAVPGTGLLNARIAGWAELSLSYMVNDQNFCVLAVDLDGALSAGVDIAGFVHAGVEVGAGRDFLDKWYTSPLGAGTWVVDQLSKLNDLAGGQLLHIEGSSAGSAKHGPAGGDYDSGHGDPNAAAFSVHDTKLFAGGNVGADFGAVKGDATYSRTKVQRLFHDADHNVIPSTEEHRELDLDLQVALGALRFGANYHRDWSNTVGSPIYYANGIFNENTLTLSVGLEALKRIGGGHADRIPSKGVQDLVTNTFATLEKAAVRFPWAKKLNQKLFDHIAQEMYKGSRTGAGLKAGVTFNVIFNWNEYGETEDELSLMYFRTLVDVDREMGVDAKTRAGGVEAGLSMSKSEVVYESIGSETISYIQRQFLYQTEERPWEAFKEANRPELEKLVGNCATEGFRYYYPEVAHAYHAGDKPQDFEAGLAALEQVWTLQDQMVKQIGPDAAKIGDHLERATAFFTFREATKQAEMAQIMTTMSKYYYDQHLLKYFVEQLPAYAIEIQDLKDLAIETGFEVPFNNVINRALSDNAA